jgi:LacI family transcriptional regulator
LSLQQAQGVIGFIAGTRNQAGVARLGVPAVAISGSAVAPILPQVLPDNEEVGRMAARHLLECGFQRFAFIGTGPLPYSKLRLRGFEAEITSRGHELAVLPNHHATDVTQWLHSLQRPVGVFAVHDNLARRVIEACRGLGLHGPQEVAVVGVDNCEALCQLAPVAVSSIDTAPVAVGYRAAQLLDAMLEGASAPSTPILVPPRGVVQRASSDVMLTDDPIAAMALRVIHSRACHGITVADVATEVRASRRTIERLLRERTGRTPHEEIRRIQFDRACQLLAHSDLKIAEVARRCGFRLPSSFAREFGRIFGQTPNAYRKERS